MPARATRPLSHTPWRAVRLRANRRMRQAWAAAAVMLAMLPPGAAHAGGPLLVVVHNDSPVQTLTRKELADIYLDLNAARSSRALHPMDRAEDPLRERFYQNLGLAPSAVRLHWAKRVFTGRGRPPPVVSSTDLMPALTQQHNALIYLESGERPPHTRVVTTLDP